MIVVQTLIDDALAAEVAPLNAQITSLTSQLSTVQANLVVTQTALSAAQAQIPPLNAQITSLNATVASLNIQIVSLNSNIADLNAQIAALLVMPAPSQANTGYRGPLGTYSLTNFPAANNVTLQSMQISLTAPLNIPGANFVMKNGRVSAPAATPYALTLSGTGFVAEDTSFQSVPVTGSGIFIRCNFSNGLTLNGVSVVKDCYIKGVLTNFTGSTLTNNTIVP